MILILTNKWDITVDFVVRELRQRGKEYLRLNTEDLISGSATVTSPHFQITVTQQSKRYNLETDTRVVWYRRPGKPFDDVPVTERPSPATQRFVNDQWYSWLESLQLVQDVVWINHPNHNASMENKIRQLQLASQLGFKTPTTIVTNSLADAVEFQNRHDGEVIAKALYSPLIEEPEQDFFIFTNRVSSDLKQQDTKAFGISPTIFQQLLAPKIDYRVTVVANTVFAVKIVSNATNVALDWRTQKEGLEFIACTLPPNIEALCRDYVKESDLLFGAIDLVEYEDEFYFLEINPNGEWGWLQKQVGLPIAETLCDLMCIHDNEGAV